MYLRTMGSLCVALVLLAGPLRSQDVEIFEPEMEAPVEPMPEVDYPDPTSGDSVPEEVPEAFPLSPAELATAQEKALTDPNAEPPDVVIALAPRSGSAAPAIGFPGLDYASGGQKTPPDISIARSTDRVLEAVNAALRLFNTDGTVRVTRTTAAFFGIPESPGTSICRNLPSGGHCGECGRQCTNTSTGPALHATDLDRRNFRLLGERQSFSCEGVSNLAHPGRRHSGTATGVHRGHRSADVHKSPERDPTGGHFARYRRYKNPPSRRRG